MKKWRYRDSNKSIETRNSIEFGKQNSRTEQAAEIKMTPALYCHIFMTSLQIIEALIVIGKDIIGAARLEKCNE